MVSDQRWWSSLTIVPNTCGVVGNQAVVNEILALIIRTEDPAIRFEATRVFVNALRSLAGFRDPSTTTSFECLADQRILDALCDMLRQSKPYPVLANESIISLALLATFGPAGTDERICQTLGAAEDVLCDIVAPVGEAVNSPEVQANAVTLLKQLGGGEGERTKLFRAGVTDVVDKATREGRPVASEAIALVKDWQERI
jgi:hypothetical protein